MNLNFDLKNIKASDWKVYAKRTGSFLVKKSRWIMIFLVLLEAGYGIYLCYAYVYNPSWSETRKQAYINSQENGTVFNKNEFDAVIARIQDRKNAYRSSTASVPDIFK